MVKNFKRIFSVLLVVGFILLAQGCGTDPAVWAAIGQGVSNSLVGGSSSGSSSYSGSNSSSSSSSQKEYIVTVSGYDSNSIMMTGQWLISASSQSAAREEGRRRFLAELPDATHVNAMAILSP